MNNLETQTEYSKSAGIQNYQQQQHPQQQQQPAPTYQTIPQQQPQKQQHQGRLSENLLTLQQQQLLQQQQFQQQQLLQHQQLQEKQQTQTMQRQQQQQSVMQKQPTQQVQPQQQAYPKKKKKKQANEGKQQTGGNIGLSRGQHALSIPAAGFASSTQPRADQMKNIANDMYSIMTPSVGPIFSVDSSALLDPKEIDKLCLALESGVIREVAKALNQLQVVAINTPKMLELSGQHVQVLQGLLQVLHQYYDVCERGKKVGGGRSLLDFYFDDQFQRSEESVNWLTVSCAAANILRNLSIGSSTSSSTKKSGTQQQKVDNPCAVAIAQSACLIEFGFCLELCSQYPCQGHNELIRSLLDTIGYVGELSNFTNLPDEGRGLLGVLCQILTSEELHPIIRSSCMHALGSLCASTFNRMTSMACFEWLADDYCQGAWSLLRRSDWNGQILDEFLGDDLGPSGIITEGRLGKEAKNKIAENLAAQTYMTVFRMMSLLAQQFPEMLVGFLCRKSIGWWLVTIIINFTCGLEPFMFFKNYHINPFLKEPGEYQHPIVWQSRKYLSQAAHACEVALSVLTQDVRSARQLLCFEDCMFEAIQGSRGSLQLPRLLLQQRKTLPTIIENSSQKIDL